MYGWPSHAVDVDVSRRRISLSIKRVGDEQPEDEAEIEAEVEPELEVELEAEVAAEAAVVAEAEELQEMGAAERLQVKDEDGEVLEEAADRADESSQEVFEATLEPAPEAPGEAAMPVEPEAAASEDAAEPASDEDVSLESILEDLKRREGRSE